MSIKENLQILKFKIFKNENDLINLCHNPNLLDYFFKDLVEGKGYIKNIQNENLRGQFISIIKNNEYKLEYIKKNVDWPEIFDERYLHQNFLDNIEYIKLNLENKNIINAFLNRKHNNIEILKDIIDKNPNNFNALNQIIDFDDNFIKQMIIKHSAKFFVNCSETIKNDYEFILSAIIVNPENIVIATDEIRKKLLKEETFLIFGQTSNIVDLMTMYNQNLGNDFDYNAFFSFNIADNSIGNTINDKLSNEQIQNLKLKNGELDNLSNKEMNLIEILQINNKYKKKTKEYELNDLVKKYNDIYKQNFSYADSFSKFSIQHRFSNNLYNAYTSNKLHIFDELLNEDPNFIKNVDFELLSDKMINILGIDNIKAICYFPNSLYILNQIEKNGKLLLFKNLIDSTNNIEMNYILKNNILLFMTSSYSNIIEEMVNKNVLTKENLLKLMNITKSVKLFPINNLNDFNNYEQKLQKYCDKNVNQITNPLLMKNIISQKFFGVSANELFNFQIMFKNYKNMILNSKYNEIFMNLELINKSGNLNELKEIYNQLNNIGFGINGTMFLNMQNEIKDNILHRFIPTQKFSGSNIIDVTNENFECLVHVVGAYGSTPLGKSVYESWNTKANANSSGICTTLINQDYIGHALEKEDSVILGFDNIDSKDIQMMAPVDMFSYTAGLIPSSKQPSSFLKSKDLINHTRAKHNEVVINRYLNMQKRQPSYIICFDKINEESKKASEDFQIPILFIDTTKFLNNKIEKFNEMKDEYLKNPTEELISKIISFPEIVKSGMIANKESLINEKKDFIDTIKNIEFLINNAKDLKTLDYIENQINIEIEKHTNEFQDKRNIAYNIDISYVKTLINNRKNIIDNNNINYTLENNNNNIEVKHI